MLLKVAIKAFYNETSLPAYQMLSIRNHKMHSIGTEWSKVIPGTPKSEADQLKQARLSGEEALHEFLTPTIDSYITSLWIDYSVPILHLVCSDFRHPNYHAEFMNQWTQASLRAGMKFAALFNSITATVHPSYLTLVISDVVRQYQEGGGKLQRAQSIPLYQLYSVCGIPTGSTSEKPWRGLSAEALHEVCGIPIMEEVMKDLLETVLSLNAQATSKSAKKNNATNPATSSKSKQAEAVRYLRQAIDQLNKSIILKWREHTIRTPSLKSTPLHPTNIRLAAEQLIKEIKSFTILDSRSVKFILDHKSPREAQALIKARKKAPKALIGLKESNIDPSSITTIYQSNGERVDEGRLFIVPQALRKMLWVELSSTPRPELYIAPHGTPIPCSTYFQDYLAELKEVDPSVEKNSQKTHSPGAKTPNTPGEAKSQHPAQQNPRNSQDKKPRAAQSAPESELTPVKEDQSPEPAAKPQSQQELSTQPEELNATTPKDEQNRTSESTPPRAEIANLNTGQDAIESPGPQSRTTLSQEQDIHQFRSGVTATTSSPFIESEYKQQDRANTETAAAIGG